MNKKCTGGQGGLSVGSRLRVITLAKVIRVSMDHNGAADNGVLAFKLDEVIHKSTLGHAIGIGRDVT